MSTDETAVDPQLAQAREWAERLAIAEHHEARRKGEVRPLPWQEGFSDEAWEQADSWRTDERVTFTPDHIEVQIYKWAPTTNEARKALERDNPDNRPPDSIKLRRMFSLDDMLALDEYDYKNEFGGRVALACILSADHGDSAGRISYAMALRASAPDWMIVDRAVEAILAGKD